MPYRDMRPGQRKRSIQIEARERKICTIAFIDIVQSTALIEDLDPEDALDRLGPSVELIMDTCEEFGASVRFVGDGALAVFGFPHADENHCIRAVEAGLAAIERVAGMATDRVDIRVGIHSGPVLFGSLSHSDFDELTATGPVVHLADKIQSAARTNSVTVSSAVVETVGEMFHTQRVQNIQVGGMDQPIELFEVVGRDQTMSRWNVRIGRGLSPFMGRYHDLGTLDQAWSSCLKGKGAAVAVIGEAGIGKSRLLHEFTGAIDITNAQVLGISATALDKQVAYGPVIRAIKLFLDVPPSAELPEITKKLGEYLNVGSAKYQQDLVALQSVFHSESDDLVWRAMGPKVRQDAIVRAMIAVIVKIAQQKPLVVIFEDMHWADKYTHNLYVDLIQTVSDKTMLVISTSRTADNLPIGTDSDVYHLHLGPLDTTSSRDLINELLGEDGKQADLGSFIEKICGQTPLFIEEIILNLKRVGVSAGGMVGQSFKVPDSVQPLIAQRIDALSPTDRQTLQIAAVIGSEFSTDLLKKLLRQEGLEVSQSLPSLAKLELLENIDGPLAKFRHALIQQVAYLTLPKRRLRYLHGQCFEIIKDMKLNSNLSAMSSLAFHAERSQRWIEAANAFMICGHLALKRAAFDDGILHFEKSIECAEKVDTKSLEITKLTMQALQGSRVAHVPKANFSRILEITSEVESLARKLGDDASVLGAGIDQVIMGTILADLSDVIPSGEEKLKTAIAWGAPGRIATAAFALSQAYWFQGNFEKAVQVSMKYGHLYILDNDRLTTGTTGTVSVLGTGTHANSLSLMGKFDEAALVCDRMKELATHTGKPYDISFHAISVGIRALQMGDLKTSVDSLVFAMETSETANIDVLRAFLSAPLARGYAGLGDMNAAQNTLDMGQNIAGPAGMSAFIAQLLAAELAIFGAPENQSRNENLRIRLVDLCRSNSYDGILGQVDNTVAGGAIRGCV